MEGTDRTALPPWVPLVCPQAWRPSLLLGLVLLALLVLVLLLLLLSWCSPPPPLLITRHAVPLYRHPPPPMLRVRTPSGMSLSSLLLQSRTY